MSTNSLAFLFYVSPNQPMSVQTIVEKFEDIREDLRIDRIDVAFSGETPDVVAYAVRCQKAKHPVFVVVVLP